MRYTSRGLRRRRDTDQWEVTLTHRDPITNEPVPSYHTVTAKTERQAQRKRDGLIRLLEEKGAAVTSNMTLAEFVDELIRHKEEGGTVERSTVSRAIGLDNGGTYVKDPKKAPRHVAP